ncbi:choice-of-anchor I family protein [Thalassotalea profundi]|uniref:Alkaline phosphatase n=1 Tax=Thalassotalea profundi TaxID=2036687 RepID=A0ABQ3J135_9GAMM|nr:choice-of-anchor I family protein [Thalassotalea profundi]GHE97603.1 alkaline phosphatase [Thalassotalea profundi]
MKLSKLLIAMSLMGLVSACTLDGDDGAAGMNGADGSNGQNGVDGIDGNNAPTGLAISLVGRAVLNADDPEGAAEIVTYQTSKNWIYAVNSSVKPAVVEVIDANVLDADALAADSEGIISGTNLASIYTLNLPETAGLNGDANSIAIDNNNELLAVAIASGTPGINGHIAFYDISGATPAFLKNVVVGDLPDNVTFNHAGTKVLVANEGEPSNDYVIDPEGSISVIDITSGVPADTAISIEFTQYNEMQSELEAQGMKFSNPSGQMIKGELRNYTVAQDLEPEYIAISEDDTTAYVTLQENNAIAIVNLADNTLQIKGLGFKDWSQHKLDVSDKDGGINFSSYQNLFGMYQPDTIVSYSWKGANFAISANEGDGREYIAFEGDAEEDAGKATCESDFPQGSYDWDDGEEICIAFTDEVRAKDLEDYGVVSADLDAYISANGGNDGLGRLVVTNALGKNEQDEYSKLYTYGARSFTIWDNNGLKVFDSGDDIERVTASIHGESFNNNEDENEGDTRSDAKGPEPEALAIGKIGTQTYAFIGLERMGGILVYNVTNPYNVNFVEYFYNRGLVAGADITGDLAPEGMKFISAEQSPTNEALLIIGNEISGSVAVWQIKEQ